MSIVRSSAILIALFGLAAADLVASGARVAAFAQSTGTAAPTDAPQSAESAIRRAMQLFAEKKFATTIEGIDALAGSGAAHAGKALAAMIRRRLYVSDDGTTGAYRDGRTFYDLISNDALGGRPDGTKSVRVNNRIRNIIKAALGSLRLRAADPATRRTAAEAVLRAGDTSVLPALDQLVATEPDPRVRTTFEQVRAGLILREATRPASEQLTAIGVLRERGDRIAIASLQRASQSEVAEIKAASEQAIAAIERRLAVIQQVQTVWYGLSLGSVLLLAAIGLAITFGVMGVINMAHGEMVMIGAYTTFVIQELFRAYAPDAFNASLLVAIPMAFLVAGAVGVAIERGIIQFLYGRPLETLLATWGVSLILQQAVRTIFGPTNRDVSAPSYMSGGFELWGLAITYNRLWIIVFTLIVFLALLAILRYTSLGLQMRAVTQNRRMAASMGIRTGYVDAMTFGLGSGVAGIAGVALSQIDNVSPNLGTNYIIDSFMVVVFGGVGNLWGTLVSAFTLGVANKILEPWAGAVLAKIAILVAIILFIQKRPRGLFALRGRAIEQ
ncbi:MAG: urea ABC transporter permease subunit UrtB [Pseudomonadota bacterium]